MADSTFVTVQENESWPWRLPDVLTVCAAYALLHAVFRWLASPNLSQDDVFANVLAQSFQLGYSGRNPPLYDWAIWLVQQITGPSLAGFLVVKYAVLLGTAGFVYAAARRVTGSARWAALTVYSLSLLSQIGWKMHDRLTASMALILMIAISFWAFVRLVDKGRWVDYLLFGICLGVGVLAKYNFLAFIAALAIAAARQGPMRQRLLQPGILVSVLVGGAIALPHGLWYLEFGKLAMNAADTFDLSDGAHLERIVTGLTRAVLLSVFFFTPLIFAVPAIFPGTFSAMGRALRAAPTDCGGEPDFARLLLHLTIVGAAMLIAAVVLLGIARLRTHYLIPLFFLAPIWIMDQARKVPSADRRIRPFLILCLAVAAFFLAGRGGYLVVGERPFCTKCSEMIPYDQLADIVRAKGFEKGTIIGGGRHVAGNLRLRFPESRVQSFASIGLFSPDPSAARGPILVVWDLERHGPVLPARVREDVERLGHRVTNAPETVSVPWRHLWRPTGYRQTLWRILLLNPD